MTQSLNMIRKREDITNIICDRLCVNPYKAESCVVAILESIVDWVANGDSIQLRNFGTLYPQVQEERMARRISENTMMRVPKRIKPKFRASKYFEDKCNNK